MSPGFGDHTVKKNDNTEGMCVREIVCLGGVCMCVEMRKKGKGAVLVDTSCFSSLALGFYVTESKRVPYLQRKLT